MLNMGIFDVDQGKVLIAEPIPVPSVQSITLSQYSRRMIIEHRKDQDTSKTYMTTKYVICIDWSNDLKVDFWELQFIEHINPRTKAEKENPYFLILDGNGMMIPSKKLGENFGKSNGTVIPFFGKDFL